ncbi:ankyrin [Acephala macrosclerotiorum]|nr:ankyrin [Acephala macrosclerotiorum]
MATIRVGILKQLVEGGADLAKCPSVLESAVYHNNMDSVKYLLDAGVNPNDKNQGVYSPLTIAVRDNRPEILEVLIARGADPNMKGQDVPLVMAVRNPAMLKQLIAGDTDVTRYQGLLELAVYHNKMESIDILLEAGVLINEKHRNHYSPLTTAIRDNRIDILKRLISKDADPNTPGEGLPFVNAVRFEDRQRLRLLLDAGADVNKQIKGQSALTEACDRIMVENVKLLLERGADVDLMDEAGKSAMDIAANKGYDDIVILLLDAMG